MRFRCAPLVVFALALGACGGGADTGAPAAPADAAPAPLVTVPVEAVAEGDPRIQLAAKMPGVKPGELRATPVAGIYELAHEGEISYVTADGNYVFSGDLFQVTNTGDFPNLSENRRRDMRRQLMAVAPEQEMIIFGKPDAPHTVTVFTDIDCQWCQHLHAQIDEYNELGIRVRYLAFPRTGPATDSWYKAEAVWCAKDRNKALTGAKRGEPVARTSCASTVAGQYELGHEVGVNATPAVVFDNGELVPGYLPPADMLEAITTSAAQQPPGN
jgi:thiol:disulfide interchange protein DsbC